MKKICFLIVFSLVMFEAIPQDQDKKTRKERQQEHAEKVKQWIDAQDYKFIAQKAIPMTGRTMDLTYGYDLQVSKDTITAYLPYFGRAYIAPIDNTEGGIKFESKEFSYKKETAKKDGWNIYIIQEDGQRRYELILRVSSNGSASLSVNDDARQSISFNGYIDDRKKK